MKRSWILKCCGLISIAIIVLLIACVNIHRHSWDISNLEIENGLESWNPLSFNEAVQLDLELSESSNYLIAEDNLKKLENQIMNETGNTVQYYQFVGSFSIKGSEEVQGTLATLVIVVDADTPYIYTVRDPLTKVCCEHNDVAWTQLNSYNEVSVDRSSVRLAAAGYISTSTKNVQNQELLSNTLYPTFTVSIQ